MQHAACIDNVDIMYPGSCKKELFRIPVFGGKVSPIYLIIYLSTIPWMTHLSSFNQFLTSLVV